MLSMDQKKSCICPSESLRERGTKQIKYNFLPSGNRVLLLPKTIFFFFKLKIGHETPVFLSIPLNVQTNYNMYLGVSIEHFV